MQNILVVHRDKPSKKQEEIFDDPKLTFKHLWKNTLTNECTKGMDAVIAIGGDGTIMSASHYLKKIPLLALNDKPRRSIGAHATGTITQLPKKLEELASNTFKTELLERIRISINDEKVEPLALNEVFFANERAYLVSNYLLKYKQFIEKQKSSGVIISTGTGSTAWFKSSGGIPFSPQSKFVKMIIREPFMGHKERKYTYKLLKTQINEGETMHITANTPSVLAIDSIREFHLKTGDTITIEISEFPLKRII